MVANPEPAVMPLDALTVLEYTSSIPMLRASLYAARDNLSTFKLKPCFLAAFTSSSWLIISKALTRSRRMAAWSSPLSVAVSAAKAEVHAARWAPIPFEPYRLGEAVSSSHSRATVARALIQTRMSVGNNPIGR